MYKVLIHVKSRITVASRRVGKSPIVRARHSENGENEDKLDKQMARYGTARGTLQYLFRYLTAPRTVVSDDSLQGMFSVEFQGHPSAPRWVMRNGDKSQDAEERDLMLCGGLHRDWPRGWWTSSWKPTGRDRRVPTRTRKLLAAASG